MIILSFLFTQDDELLSESGTSYTSIRPREVSPSTTTPSVDRAHPALSLHPFGQQDLPLAADETQDTLLKVEEGMDQHEPLSSPNAHPGYHFDQPIRFKRKEKYTSVEEALVRQPGPVVIARVFARKYRNLSMSMITSAMTNLTSEPGMPSYFGQYKVVSGGTKVFFKCPPALLHTQALETYGLTAEAYQQMYDSESDAPASSGPRDWRNFIRKVMEVSPFAEILASMSQWGDSCDRNLAAEGPSSSLSSSCLLEENTKPIQIKTECEELHPASDSENVHDHVGPRDGQRTLDLFQLGDIKTEFMEENTIDSDDNYNKDESQPTRC